MSGLSCVTGLGVVVVCSFIGTATCSACMYGKYIYTFKAEGLK